LSEGTEIFKQRD